MKGRPLAAVAAALVAALLAIDYYYLGPLSASLRDDIQLRYGVLRRDEQFVKEAGSTSAGLEAYEKEMKSFEGRLMKEKSEFLASARLQEKFSELTRKAGLAVTTVRPGAAVKLGPYNGIPLYAEGSGTIQQVSALLREVEEEPMLLKVDKLSLAITNMQNPLELRFKIQVSGLAQL
jgi:Tfp pilus assembly protein PilO